MESQRSMSGIWGSRRNRLHSKKAWVAPPLQLLSPAAHKGALLDMVHSLHADSLSGHFIITTSLASWGLVATQASPSHIYTAASRGPSGDV